LTPKCIGVPALPLLCVLSAVCFRSSGPPQSGLLLTRFLDTCSSLIPVFLRQVCGTGLVARVWPPASISEISTCDLEFAVPQQFGGRKSSFVYRPSPIYMRFVKIRSNVKDARVLTQCEDLLSYHQTTPLARCTATRFWNKGNKIVLRFLEADPFFFVKRKSGLRDLDDSPVAMDC
jgi:hypothetical protein